MLPLSSFFKQVLALVARGIFSYGQMACAPPRARGRRGVSTPPSLPLDSTLPQRVRGCSPLTNPKTEVEAQNASRFAKRIFCASPIYGSAEDFTSLLNFTPCRRNASCEAANRRNEKKRLAQRQLFPFRLFSFSGKRRAAPSNLFFFSLNPARPKSLLFCCFFFGDKENLTFS